MEVAAEYMGAAKKGLLRAARRIDDGSILAARVGGNRN
jgi:hypothetical protein